jgi:hypothetical protein|tara:strand:- start:79 stop:279 length:201 start_codon:yes stop_codon:yes gene_type:complete
MKKKKTNRDDSQVGRFEDHDYHGYYKRARKNEKRKVRHNKKKDIRDVVNGGLTPEEYEDYYGDYDQ